MSTTLAGFKRGLSSIFDASKVSVNNVSCASVGNFTITDGKVKPKYISAQSHTLGIDGYGNITHYAFMFALIRIPIISLIKATSERGCAAREDRAGSPTKRTVEQESE